MTDRGEVNAGIDAKLKRMYDRRDAMRDGIEKRIAVENGLDPTDRLDLARAANATTKAIERWERLEIADPSLTPTSRTLKNSVRAKQYIESSKVTLA
jgi:hypothetical protein